MADNITDGFTGQVASMGRIVRYVSNKAPYVESPALVIMTPSDFREDTPDGDRYRLSGNELHLLVWGAANDYREYNVPHSSEGMPGSWHWPERS